MTAPFTPRVHRGPEACASLYLATDESTKISQEYVALRAYGVVRAGEGAHQ